MKDQKASFWFCSLLCYCIYYMRKYPMHVTWAQGKTLNTLCITWGIKSKKFDKQFTTVTTHNSVQNYYKSNLMFDLKKYRGVIFQGTEGWCKIWRKTWLVVWKMTWGIWWILIWALESLKNFHFNALLLNKVYIA